MITLRSYHTGVGASSCTFGAALNMNTTYHLRFQVRFTVHCIFLSARRSYSNSLCTWHTLRRQQPLLILFVARANILHFRIGIVFYKNILRTSAVSSTNFGSILIFASCVVGTVLVIYYVGEFFKWEGSHSFVFEKSICMYLYSFCGDHSSRMIRTAAIVR